ncbi:MAG: hypothetical protein UHP25_07705 [Prevotella sp.]|nr:hypothetical protein [Prevotella sp.]
MVENLITALSTTLLSSVGKPSHLWRNWLFLLDDERLDIYQHLAKRWITPLSNVENTLAKRWIIPLTNVENTLAKRWAILLPNIEMRWQNIGLYLIYNKSALLINLHLDDRNIDMKVLRVFVGVRLVFGNPQNTNAEHHLKPLSYNRLRHDRCSMFDLFPKTQILD